MVGGVGQRPHAARSGDAIRWRRNRARGVSSVVRRSRFTPSSIRCVSRIEIHLAAGAAYVRMRQLLQGSALPMPLRRRQNI
ncbi:hypothetical protein PputUW4_02043 [Pseudomonas sp. UW4]|nr:hypothetical protein PputUW4_02043 [Pseudomonas sp. UW4]